MALLLFFFPFHFFFTFRFNSLIALKQNSMPDCPMRSNTKKQPSIQCRVCGTISISKIENNFLSTNPTTLILSTLVSEF